MRLAHYATSLLAASSNTAVFTGQLVDWHPPIISKAGASNLCSERAKLMQALKRVRPFGRHFFAMVLTPI